MASWRRGRMRCSNGLAAPKGTRATKRPVASTMRRPSSISRARTSQATQRPCRSKWLQVQALIAARRGGTMLVAIIWECGCDSEAPPSAPRLRKITTAAMPVRAISAVWRSRQTLSTSASSSGASDIGVASCRGVSMITSCTPSPGRDAQGKPGAAVACVSGRSAGYLFGTTRTCQPGGAVAGNSSIIPGSMPSLPGQNGQARSWAASPAVPSRHRSGRGRAPRSGATITQAPVRLSRRYSLTGPPCLLRRGRRGASPRQSCLGLPRPSRCPLPPGTRQRQGGRSVPVRKARPWRRRRAPD